MFYLQSYIDLPLNLIAETTVFCVSFIVVSIFFLKKKRKSPPPGPFGLPVVGYLPFLDPKAPYETLASLVDDYGPVYSVRLGSVLGIVVADPDLVKKVLSMEETTGRAPLYLTHGIMKGYGLICAQGSLWKDHRKFVMGFMRSNGMRASLGRNELQEWVSETANDFLTNLECCPDEGLDPSSLLLHYIGNAINQLIFGLSYTQEDQTWLWLKSLLEEGSKMIGVAGPLNFLPWLRFLPRFRKVIDFITINQKETHKEYEKIVVEKEKDFISKLQIQKQSGQPLQEVKCLIDAYIKERHSRGENIGTFHNDQLFHVAADMFGAGSETTVTTLRWHLLDLALNPQVQDRIRAELQELVGCQEDVSMDCIARATYGQAAFMETQRLRSIVPTGIPHGVTKEITVEGFTFPKGSMILPLQWRIHRDPKYWQDPLKYDPNRFLHSDGTIVKSTAFMPFQTGRRMCIGDEFAKIILLTFIYKIVLRFQVKLPEKELTDDPTKDPICGITLVPKLHNLIFVPINPT